MALSRSLPMKSIALQKTIAITGAPRLTQGRSKAAVKPSVRAQGRVLAAPVRAQAAGTQVNWEKTAQTMENASPLQILDHALATFGDTIAIAFSGAEDVALIEYAHLTGRKFRVFSLDTGRLNPETYRLFDKVEKHYGIKIEYTFPDAQEVTDLVNAKGLFSFYEDGHQECCRIRKVKPLRKKLKTLKAWITGQRKDQSPGTRADVPVCQVDPVFEGVDGGAGSLIKYNPLTNMTSAEVWNFLRVMNVPTNDLHNCGYVSIGCEPCTRPVLPNQQEREGRWWWEDSAAKECGLHSGNKGYKEGEQDGDKKEVRDLWEGGAVQKLDKASVQNLVAGKRDKDTMIVLYAPWCRFCQGMEGSFGEVAEAFKGKNVQLAKYQSDTDREYVAETFGLKTFPTIVYLPAGKTGFVKYPSERRDVDTLSMWIKGMISAKI